MTAEKIMQIIHFECSDLLQHLLTIQQVLVYHEFVICFKLALCFHRGIATVPCLRATQTPSQHTVVTPSWTVRL